MVGFRCQCLYNGSLVLSAGASNGDSVSVLHLHSAHQNTIPVTHREILLMDEIMVPESKYTVCVFRRSDATKGS